jgi:hypothetical protein
VVPEADNRKVAKLRRSPISGDWRRVNGNLELTAALAVNVPAFPVYAMDNGDQTALVAAGTLEPHEEIPTGIDPAAPMDMALVASQVAQQVVAELNAAAARVERAGRISDLAEDEEIYAQREREARFAALVGDK